ncbi:M48 family metallopeptidase [Sphingomonas tabacisoli]|uniref:M48 family metallopeptidase n=1 Tax=Sphingomonas tabacisoli TaxID=2249466 RepID=A0ABW4HX54_9SPHN
MKTIFSKAEPQFAGKPVKVVRHAAARVMRLRVDPRDGAVRLTLPRRASLRHAYAWVETQRPWVEAQLARIPSRTAFAPGMTLDVAGETLTFIPATTRVTRRDGAVVYVGGNPALFEARVLRWLKAEARRVLDAETRAIAAEAGVTVACVSVSDTRSRWGSCSANGDIRYSWRLILAPPFVRRSTVAHEVAHRVHMNHGPAFKALERKLLGESPAGARAWLRTHGASLHQYGRP